MNSKFLLHDEHTIDAPRDGHATKERLTREEALAAASKYGFEIEVQELLDSGESPEGALLEYDIL